MKVKWLDKKVLIEKLFEDMLIFASREEAERLAEEFQSEDELKAHITPTKVFEKKMQKMIKHQKQKSKNKRNLGVLSKMAAGLVVFLFIGAALVMGVDASRARLFNMATEIKIKFMQFMFVEKDEDRIGARIPEGWKDIYLPTYLPKGFAIDEMRKVGNGYYIITYSSIDKKRILFSQFPAATTTLGVDNENTTTNLIKIGQHEAYLIQKNVEGMLESKLVWHDEVKGYILSATIKKDDLIKVAESIKKSK